MSHHARTRVRTNNRNKTIAVIVGVLAVLGTGLGLGLTQAHDKKGADSEPQGSVTTCTKVLQKYFADADPTAKTKTVKPDECKGLSEDELNGIMDQILLDALKG